MATKPPKKPATDKSGKPLPQTGPSGLSKPAGGGKGSKGK